MKLSSRTKISLILIGVLTMILAGAAMASPIDSVKEAKTEWHVVPRMQSLGLFAYAGGIGCDNPTFDINVGLERGKWGYFLFKSFDLDDLGSHNNFALTMVYRKFPLGKRLEFRPYLGFLLDQTNHLAGKHSDLSLVFTTIYTLNDHWKIDNSSIFPHLLFNPDSNDWINRFRVIFSQDHVEFTLMSWHSNKFIDRETYLSEGLSAFYNKIRLSDHAYLNTGVTGLWVLQSSNEEITPKKNGLLLTLSVVFEN